MRKSLLSHESNVFETIAPRREEGEERAASAHSATAFPAARAVIALALLGCGGVAACSSSGATPSGNGEAGASASSAGNGSAGGTAGSAGNHTGGGGGSIAASGSAGTSGSNTSGAGGSGGATGSAGTSNGGAGGVSGTLPALHVQGNQLKTASGSTVILRGSSLIDIGALYTYAGKSAAGITARLDTVAAAGVQGHVVRLPVYPEITYNGTVPTCSPLPYPVGTGPSASCSPTPSLSASDYVSKVLKPAVDYATSKNLYVIIDFHQIDDITARSSAADATTFWTDIAPQFANYPNVLYEAFNEPIDTKQAWSALKPVVQGFINTIRAAAPNNLIIVPSHSWDQHTGDAATDPPTGTNLIYTAHIYPSNWSTQFQAQVTTAAAKVPVFVSEWGYANSDPNPHTWGMNLQTTLDGNGASWTAWVTDNAWSPSMFSDKSLTTLTDFGSLVKAWLAAKATSDWVQ
jgi:Cellulase (glycosyl hydrolase family 5)